MLWLCGWDEDKMLARLALLESELTGAERTEELDATKDDPDFEDILERGHDLGAGEWL
jgi:hypothetical protein